MRISFPPIQRPATAPVRFQATSNDEAWMNKLDTTLQKLYQKHSKPSVSAFPWMLAVGISFKPDTLTPALTQQMKAISLEGTSPQQQTAAEQMFHSANVPGKPWSEYHLSLYLHQAEQLKKIAQLDAVEKITDGSYWAHWDVSPKNV